MTIKTFHQRLSGQLFPKEWEELVCFTVEPETPFILDVVPEGDYLHVYVSSRSLREDFQPRLTFSEQGAALHIESVRPIVRGVDIILARKNAIEAQNIAVELDDNPVELEINPNLADNFEGLNTVFLIEVDPNPETFKNWLEYHCDTQGLEAVAMLRRCESEWPDNSSAKELIKVAKKTKGLKTFALFDSNIPLGHPSYPSVLDRHTTPDGPGKRSLDPAVPAPYASALFELSIMDAIRKRSFNAARVAAHMGMYDLLLRGAGGQTVFEAAETSDTYLKFKGRLAYPFAYRKPKKPHFADHTCTSLGGKTGPNIWAMSNAFMQNDPTLRPFRASLLEPDPIGDSFSYWRCIGVNYPYLKTGQLVPKASLVTDKELCKLLSDQFNYETKYQPVAKADYKTSTKNDRILIVTTMKNEGPFILEWLAYHMSIGVTDFIVYTNDCTDGTDTMFDLLQRKGIVDHCENPYREAGLKPQHAAYFAAQLRPKAKEADWVICMDVDEYINIHVGAGTLHDLFAAVPEANLWSMTWRMFGNAEVDLFEDKFITEQFFRCAAHICPKPHQAWGFKTMFRNNGYYKKFGIHRPVALQPERVESIHWVNGSGLKMPEEILTAGWRSSKRTYGYDMVTLNHYGLRSCESFLVKRDRGRVNHVNRDQGMAYWFRMNNNAELDRSIENKIARAKAKFDELMADEEIAAQHKACVKAHRLRINELKELDEYKTMYETINSERMVKLSRLHSHFHKATFLEGPDSVPLDFPHLDEVEL